MDMGILRLVVRELAVPPYHVARVSVVPESVDRRENDAEHSFALGLVAVIVAPLVDEKLDQGLLAKYALIHDLPEIYSGDVSVYADAGDLDKKELREEEARERIRAEFGDRFPWLIDDLYRYKRLDDAESRFVYALDKLLPHMTTLLGDRHPVRPTWSAYKVTEEVARRKITATFPALLPLFDELCEEFARRPEFFAGGVTSLPVR
ncbi:HD domain-containing protein [Herbidospora daliensis]|uniref:HD domain-containing protein n=1 Tax=Herbidospora daliensis TaxID=295585 RepID=UPI000784989E|nr:HD domain-containing protein [Herbidospora daliensis]